MVEPRRVELLLKHCKCFFLPLKEGPTKICFPSVPYSAVNEPESLSLSRRNESIKDPLPCQAFNARFFLGGRAPPSRQFILPVERPTATRQGASRLSCRSSPPPHRCRRTRRSLRRRFPSPVPDTGCCGCRGHRSGRR